MTKLDRLSNDAFDPFPRLPCWPASNLKDKRGDSVSIPGKLVPDLSGSCLPIPLGSCMKPGLVTSTGAADADVNELLPIQIVVANIHDGTHNLSFNILVELWLVLLILDSDSRVLPNKTAKGTCQSPMPENNSPSTRTVNGMQIILPKWLTTHSACCLGGQKG